MTEIEKAVFEELHETCGWAVEPGMFPCNILDRLVEMGLAEKEIRIGVPIYWKASNAQSVER